MKKLLNWCNFKIKFNKIDEIDVFHNYVNYIHTPDYAFSVSPKRSELVSPAFLSISSY